MLVTIKVSRILIYVTMLLVLAGCTPPQSSISQTDGILTIVLDIEPDNIDPHITSENSSGIILRQLYDTLVYRDPETDTIIPGLAVKWATSSDDLVYTFNLRTGVQFHDQTQLNSTAVGKNFDRIVQLHANNGQGWYDFSRYYAGYEIVDDYTIKLKLSQPYAAFLDMLTQPYFGIANPDVFSDYTINRYQFHQVGTGPFMLVNYLPGKEILLQRNPNYKWGPIIYDPKIDNSVKFIRFQFIASSQQRAKYLDQTNPYIVTNILPEDAQALAGNSLVKVVSVRIAGQPYQYLINTARFPTDNVAFRQALLYSANRNFILDNVFQRFASVAWSPFVSNSTTSMNQLKEVYASDIGKAQSLLASIGYNDTDNNGYLDLGGVETTITVLTRADDISSQISKMVIQQWQQIGIRAKIVTVPTFSALSTEVENNEYNLVEVRSNGTDPAILSDYFTSNAPFNWSHVNDASLTSLLTQSLTTLDPHARESLYAQIQQQIMTLALILPIGVPTRLDAVDNTISQLTYDAAGIPLLANVIIK